MGLQLSFSSDWLQFGLRLDYVDVMQSSWRGGQYHSNITIVWTNFYVNNGDVTSFRAWYFKSFHKNEVMVRSRKTDGQIGLVNTIIWAAEF